MKTMQIAKMNAGTFLFAMWILTDIYALIIIIFFKKKRKKNEIYIYIYIYI